MKCPHCGKFIAAPKVGAKTSVRKAPAKRMYYDAPLVGMTMWEIKAIYKVGQAGRRGRGGAKLSKGKVFDNLRYNGCIMLFSDKGKKPEKWMLTAVGQYHYNNIKFK